MVPFIVRGAAFVNICSKHRRILYISEHIPATPRQLFVCKRHKRLQHCSMFLRAVLDGNQFVFFLFGQAPMPTSIRRHLPKKGCKCIEFSPALFVLIFVCVSNYFCLIHTNFYQISNDWVDTISGSVLLFVAELQIVITIIQPHLLRRKWIQFNVTIIDIENDLGQIIHPSSLKISTIAKSYYAKVTIVVVTFASFILSKILLYRSAVPWQTEIAYFYLRSYKYIAVLHAVSHVDLLHGLMSRLRMFAAMPQDRIDSFFPIRSVMQNFEQFKNIHYKLCMAAQLVNEIFGWSIVLCIVIALVDFTYISYWIFFYVNRGEVIYAIRMYNTTYLPILILIIVQSSTVRLHCRKYL